MSGKDTYLRYSVVYSDNKSYLKETLGEQSFCIIDSCNRRLYVWQRQLSSGSYWILTAPERGTSYEVDDIVDLNEVMDDIFKVFRLVDLKDKVLSNVNLKREG